MSGGHYEYNFYQLEELADNIEKDFLKDGKYLGEDYSIEADFYGKRKMVEYDRIGDATEEQRIIILAEIKSLVLDLKRCYKRAKELDYYMSGDTGATSYLERLNER